MLMTSVIICTYNRELYLPKCLEHLKNQTADPKSYEIVIVNNNSSDSTDAICKEFCAKNPALQITYIIETTPGLSAARNCGIQNSKGELLCFIDDDGFAFPDYVDNLIRIHATHPEILAFGGRIYPEFEKEKPIWLTRWLMPLLSVLDKGDEITFFKGNSYPIGANMGFTKSIISQIGDFNSELGRKGDLLLGGEEKDFFYRIKNEHIQIYYLPHLKITHIIPASRLHIDYIKRLGIGIGLSEQKRTKSEHTLIYLFSIVLEMLKWGATFFLAFYYFFIHIDKSKFLLKFRWWVTKGLIFTK